MEHARLIPAPPSEHTHTRDNAGLEILSRSVSASEYCNRKTEQN